MLHSARQPAGRLVCGLQRVGTWIERRPLAAAHLGFAALAGLTIADSFATGFAWRMIGDALSAISMFDAISATAAPIGLFLLARGIRQQDEGRAAHPHGGHLFTEHASLGF